MPVNGQQAVEKILDDWPPTRCRRVKDDAPPLQLHLLTMEQSNDACRSCAPSAGLGRDSQNAGVLRQLGDEAPQRSPQRRCNHLAEALHVRGRLDAD